MRAMDTAAVREWMDACVESLHALRTDIDDINVYPVADSDTGSNLLHTVTAANTALARPGDREDRGGTDDRDDAAGAGAALRVLAVAAVRGARGNSGIILSQFFRGLADSVGTAAELDGCQLATALGRADAAATGAVARPVAGTMLSVLHAAADAVRAAGRDRPAVAGALVPAHEVRGAGNAEAPDPAAGDIARIAAKAAADALAETPAQLAELAAAGVVDAGGRGVVAVLDALVAVLTGERAGISRPLGAGAGTAVPAPARWEVMYLLTVTERGSGSTPAAPTGADTSGGSAVPETEAPIPELRRALSALGDSVTVAATGEGDYAIHVHCTDIGAALEAGLRHGRPHQVRVESLRTPAQAETPVLYGSHAVVAVVHGDALTDLIGAEGVPVLTVRADAEPGADELVELIVRTGASHVTVLPGGTSLTAAAERVGSHPRLAEHDVVVVPCASPVQVLSALAVHDPQRRAAADVVAMAEAAAATRRGEIRVAHEDAITWLGPATAGAVVGLIDGEVVLIDSGRDAGPAALDVLDKMLAVGGELVTVLVGADAPEGIAEMITRHLRAARPEVELLCYPGGQTDALLLMGVE